MPTSVIEENYEFLYPRLTAIIQEIRNSPKNPVLYWPFQRKLIAKFGSEERFTQAIDFLVRELRVAVQTITEKRSVGTSVLRYKNSRSPYIIGEWKRTHIGIIPSNLPKSIKVFMQIHPRYFKNAYNMKK